MSPKTKAPSERVHRSGWCGLNMAPDSHARCRGAYSGARCPCECHAGHQDAPEPVQAVSGDPGPFLAYHCATCMCPQRAGLVGVEAMDVAMDVGGASAQW